MSLLPLAGVTNLLGIPGGITVERTDNAGWTTDGDAAPGDVQTFNVCPVIVQPASGRDISRLPVGDQSLETIIIHAREVLRTAREASQQAADRVLFKEPTPTPAGLLEGRYTVVKAADWQEIGGFTRLICQKQEADTP